MWFYTGWLREWLHDEEGLVRQTPIIDKKLKEQNKGCANLIENLITSITINVPHDVTHSKSNFHITDILILL